MSDPIIIKSVADFLDHVKENQPSSRYIYRGVKDAAWGVVSSAAIRIGGNLKYPNLLHNLFLGYIHQIIDEVTLHYPNTYKDLAPLEIMAHLQHSRVATGLIDFTYNPLVALWFACESGNETAGKVAMLDTQQPINDKEIEAIKTTDYLEKDLEHFFADDGKWFLWQPAIGNTNIESQRLTMQQSIFLFGGIVLPSSAYTTFLISADSKQKIKKELEALSITEKQLFSDLAGFMERNQITDSYDNNLAEHYYTQKIKAHGGQPDNIRASNYYQRANFRFALQQYDRADKDYDMAIASSPNDAVPYNNQGLAKIYLGQFDEAVKVLDKAIALNPNESMPYNNRGLTKNNLGQFEDAIKDLDKAIALNPNSANAFCNKGIAESKVGRFGNARKYFEHAMNLAKQQGNEELVQLAQAELDKLPPK